MMRTLILGAGFGGLTVAHELRRRLGDDHEIVLVDRRPEFVMGLRKPWAAAGFDTLEAGLRARSRLAIPGVRCRSLTVTRIDPAARRVETDAGPLDGDFLVVALGAEPRPDLVPGLAEYAHDLYEAEKVPALAAAFQRFASGTILIFIAGGPYKCPPAPFETALLFEERLRERGIRERASIQVATFQPILLPNAGKAGSAWVGGQLEARGIAWRAGVKLKAIGPRRVFFEDGEIGFDLLVGIPPHRPPAVIAGSGLTGEGAWVMVDRGSLRTSFERVFAIGDVTHIPLANQLPLPKAGLFAEREGQQVAAEIAAEVRGESPPPPFDGNGFCFIETGRHTAGLVEGEFFATPEPKVAVVDVSAARSEQKHRFEAERLARWFVS